MYIPKPNIIAARYLAISSQLLSTDFCRVNAIKDKEEKSVAYIAPGNEK